MQELWFYVGQGGELSKATTVSDATSLKIKDKAPDKGLVNALTSTEGPLVAGAMPRVGNVSEGGTKALLESMGEDKVTNKKGKRQSKATPKATGAGSKAEEVTPNTPKEEAEEARTDILKAATEARKYALGLEHVNYSGELVNGLMKFSQKMEAVYKKITELGSQKDPCNSKYEKLLAVIAHQMSWYTGAEAG